MSGINQPHRTEIELKIIDLATEELRGRFLTRFGAYLAALIGVLTAILAFILTYPTGNPSLYGSFNFLALLVSGVIGIVVFVYALRDAMDYNRQLLRIDDLIASVRAGRSLGTVRETIRRLTGRNTLPPEEVVRRGRIRLWPLRYDSWLQTAIQTLLIIITIVLALQQIGLSQPFQYAPSVTGTYYHNTGGNSLATVDIRGYRNIIVYIDAHVVFPQPNCGGMVIGYPPYTTPGPLGIQASIDSGNSFPVSNSTGNTCDGLVRYPAISISQLGSSLTLSSLCYRQSGCNESISFTFTSLLVR